MLKRLASLLLVSFVAACGGGGGDSGASPFGTGGSGSGSGGGTSGSSNGTASIALSLSSATVTAGAPSTVSAVVRDATGAGVTGKLVNFTTSGGLGVLSAGSALTDSTGTAVVSLSPASTTAAGADEVVATATVDGASVQATVGFQLTATSVTIASFTSDLASLGPYAQTTLDVVLSGAPAATPVTINVSSGCVAKGKATLTPTSATTTTGAASFTYRDQGCGATDLTDALQASVTGTAATASLSIGLTSPSVSSITFVSASAPTIYLKGSGLNETSLVTFQVRDSAGNGLPNQSVSLEATTLTGGLTLDGSSVSPLPPKLSDSLGNVLVRINSGTVPTPVRIKASLVSDPSVSTVSSNLAIAVGLPSQLNFSLSQGTRNIEGYNVDGTPNTYNIIASDRLGNPVPDDTAINFVAEGGQVEAIKFTALASGLARASANFVSAEPRPVDGRVTILAYSLGEESFLDTNGNNVYDSGEQFQDLGNLFLDRYFDGYYDNATDQFISLSISGAQNCVVAASSLLAIDKTIPSIAQSNTSVLPAVGTCDGLWGRAYVRRALETVLSTSEAGPVWYSKPSNLYDVSTSACSANIRKDVTTDPSVPQDLITGYVNNVATRGRAFYSFGGGSLYGVGGAGALSFLVADANPVRLNPMPAGTTVSASATTGLTVAVLGGSPVPSTTEATFTTISYEFTGAATSGVISVTFTSPLGLKTTVSQTISSAAAPGTLVLCP